MGYYTYLYNNFYSRGVLTMNKIKYISSAIDINSVWARKYLALVAADDKVDTVEVHHIVPVAFYEIVLGISYTRHSDSKDMVKDNLVSLSRGHHLLAHYYLYKCAMPCIKAAMASALSMMLKGRDIKKRLSDLTEEQVIELSNAADEAKKFSGWKVRSIPGGFIGKYLYSEGKVTHGFILKPSGKVMKYVDNVNGFSIDEDYGDVHMCCGEWGARTFRIGKYNRHKMEYDIIPLPIIDGKPECYDKGGARLAFTFRELIRCFYPRFNKRFGQEWETLIRPLNKKFPNLTPFDIVKPPKM